MGQEEAARGGLPQTFSDRWKISSHFLATHFKEKFIGPARRGMSPVVDIYTESSTSLLLLLLGVLNGCACGCRSCPSRVFGEACAAAWHRLISNTARRVGTCRARCQLFVRSKRWKQQQSIRELSPDLLFGRFSWCAEKGGRTDSPIQQNWIRFFFVYLCVFLRAWESR